MRKFSQKRLYSGIAVIGLTAAVPAFAQEQTFELNIPAQDLTSSLRAFARVSGQQVVFDERATASRQAPAVNGSHTVREALNILLSGSGLAAKPQGPGRFVVQSSTEASGKSDRGTSADEDIVVVATRRGLRVTETPAPVDRFSGETLSERGDLDLAKKLQVLAPSFNYTRAQGLSSAVGTRPASLRGLGIDQVLVLVNGRRRHAAATLDTNNGFGRGTVPVDLNAIPVTAIDRVEILRDGASAQYGSDAIAGVINIVLRGDREGGLVLGEVGGNENGDGKNGIVAVRHGFALGNGGFFTATGEFRFQNLANFAGIDTRVGRRTLKIGEPESRDLDLTLNGELPTSWGSVFADANFVRRETESFSGLFRLPNYFPAIYPNGTAPGVRQVMYDFGGTLGTQTSLGAWNVSLSDTVGYNRADFEGFDTVNRSLGSTSPTRFDQGAQRYFQNLVNLTVNRNFDNILAGARLVAGIESRYEEYELVRGEPDSYFGEGAGGFNPPTDVNVHRSAVSAFVDGELELVEGLRLGAAGRYEHYSDFGDQVTGKGSVFWRASGFLALRATASTGVRAPSLQQQYFATVTTQFIAPTPANPSGLVLVRNAAVDDPIAEALGAVPLKQETSRSISAGVVLSPLSNFDIIGDYFKVNIDDRIVYSEILQGPAVNAILAAAGVANANTVRFFTNAADTRTEGFEITARWRGRITNNATASLSLSYADFKNEVKRVSVNPVLPSLPLLAQRALLVLTDAQPRDKLALNGDLQWDRLGVTLDIVRFGSSSFVPLAQFQEFSPEVVVDLSLNYRLTDSLTVQGGIMNLFDNYPDEIIGQLDGRRYESIGGLNAEGRKYSLRLTKKF